MSNDDQKDQSREKWWRFGAALHMDLAHVTRLNTMKLVLFVARQTFGWRCRAAIMSYDEILHGRWVGNNRHKDVSGLKNDAGISEAIKDALQRGLLEMQHTTLGVAYRIPDSYWNEAEVAPDREFWEYTPPWTAYIAESAQETIAPSTIETAQEPKTAMDSQAKQKGNHSTLLRKPEQSDQETIAAKSRDASPEAASQAPLDTSPDTSSRDFKLDTFGAPKVAPSLSVKNEEQEEDDGARRDDPAPSKQEQSEQERQRQEDTAAAKQAAEQAERKRLIAREQQRIDVRLLSIPGEITRLEATLKGSTPAHTGYDLTSQKLAAWQGILALLQQQDAAEPLSEARAEMLHQEEALQLKIKAIDTQLRAL